MAARRPSAQARRRRAGSPCRAATSGRATDDSNRTRRARRLLQPSAARADACACAGSRTGRPSATRPARSFDAACIIGHLIARERNREQNHLARRRRRHRPVHTRVLRLSLTHGRAARVSGRPGGCSYAAGRIRQPARTFRAVERQPYSPASPARAATACRRLHDHDAERLDARPHSLREPVPLRRQDARGAHHGAPGCAAVSRPSVSSMRPPPTTAVPGRSPPTRQHPEPRTTARTPRDPARARSAPNSARHQAHAHPALASPPGTPARRCRAREPSPAPAEAIQGDRSGRRRSARRRRRRLQPIAAASPSSSSGE
jgi:hypothetical protein